MELDWATLTVILTFVVIFVNGWTDAPNAISTVVATGGLALRQAAFLAALCNCLGVAVMVRVSPAVAYSIGSIVNLSGLDRALEGEAARRAAGLWEASPQATHLLLCAALSAIILWSVGAWIFGIPTSESHSLIAALTGAALAAAPAAARGSEGGGLQTTASVFNAAATVIRWDVWITVMVGLVGSVIVGFTTAFLVCYLLEGRKDRGKRRHRRRYLLPQILSAMAMAFMHGAQDGQKFLGILLLVIQENAWPVASFGAPELAAGQIPLQPAVLCAAVMGLGTLTGGRRIVEKVGHELVELDPREGCAADGTAAGCLLGASLLGFPVSTTHVKTAAVLGAGLCGGRKIDRGVVRDLGLTWLLTFPGCGLLGFVFVKVLLFRSGVV